MSHTEAVPAPAAKPESPFSVEVTPEGVAVVSYDVPGASMNTLRADFADSFTRMIQRVENDPDVRAAVIVSGKPDSFIAGADIEMLEAIQSESQALDMIARGHEVIGRLASASKPFVAAVHGPALGGGFEVALACRGRVLSHSKKTALGFPEVKLGLLPGLNGLQRFAAIAGLQAALDHGLTGKSLYPDKARKLGIADEVVPRAILQEVAIELALALSRGEGKRARRERGSEKLQRFALERNPIGRALLFKKARETVRKETGGHYPAPERIIDLLECYARDGFEVSRDLEARAFAELLRTDVSRCLRQLFFATTALKKDPGVDDPRVQAREVGRVAMLGAGLMGAGIAYVSIDGGLDVRMKDRDAAAVGRGLKYVAGILDQQLERRRITRAERSEKLARLTSTTDYSGMRAVDLVIEAVFEDLALKRSVLADVEKNCRDGVIFASNTSSIPIGEIAAQSARPANVVGMHYFSPVHKMPLLEVIRTAKTADEVVATAVAVGKQQGKTVIVVKDGVGFYTSRVLGPYMNEASYILSEGASVEAIDQAMTAWGWPVGPLTLLDEVGIDVAAHVGPIMLRAFGERMTPPATVARLIEDDRKGRKNERGIYRYGAAAKKKGKEVDETVYPLLGLAVPKAGSSPVPRDEIQRRCNLQFLNEALHCWGEGILRSPRDGDIGAIFGLGFPPFLGGPFRYVDTLGAAVVLAQIEAYHDRFGRRWTPAPALVEMARSGKRFYD